MAVTLTTQQLSYLPPELRDQIAGFTDQSMSTLQKVLQSQVEGGVFSALGEAQSATQTARSVEQNVQTQRNNAMIHQQTRQQISDEYAQVKADEDLRSRLAKELELARALNGLGESSLKTISQKMGQ